MNKLLLYLFVFGCFYTTYASSVEAIENPPIDLFVCDDNDDGFATFDLTINNAIVLGTQNPADFTITYYLTQADASADAFPIANANAFTSNDATIFVRVEEIANNDLFEIGVFNLIVSPIPDVPSDLGNTELCSENGQFAMFDLTIYEAIATGGDPNLIVTYFESSADLLITSPEAYTNVVNPELINVRVTNLITNCTATSTITLIVNPLPVPIQPALYEVCDDIESGSDVDDLAIFDLRSRDDEITGGNPDLIVSYHLSQNHANAGTPTLPDMYQNTESAFQTIWVRVENTLTGCYDITTLTLSVNLLPSPSSIPDVIVCDDNDDGIGIFNLTALEDAILNGETSASLSFHETLEAAELGTPAIATPDTYASIANPQTIYVRATDIDPNTSTACFRIITITLIVNPIPPISTPLPDLTTCNDGTNQFIFDLTQNEVAIFGALDPLDYTLTYHENQTDAENDVLSIASPESYFVTAPGTTVWIRLEDNITECASIASFNVNIVTLLFTAPPAILEACDSEGPLVGTNDDGITTFDLTVLDNGIIGDDPTLVVNYYESQADLDAGIFIDPADTYINTGASPQTIFIQISSTTTSMCMAQSSVDLIVNPLPSPATPSDIEVCDFDNDGIFDFFTLSDSNAEITNGETNIEITYFLTEADAINAPVGLELDDMTYINLDPFFQTVYARVESTITGCFAVVPLNLIILNTPTPNVNPDPYEVCDDNGDGLEVFDLSSQESQILDGLDPTIFSITWFVNQAAVDANVPIPNPSNYISNTNIVIAVVTDIAQSTTTFCSTQVQLELLVSNCNDMDDDGVLDVDEDLNNNGNLDDDDTDNDDIPNYLDDDDDGDTVMTIDEITGIGAGFAPQDFIDTDDDLIENYLDDDDDGDNVLTIDEDYNDSGSPLDDDINMNDIPDFLDPEVALSTDEFMVTHFTIYPNPVIDNITITGSNPFEKISIYDITGKLVLEQAAEAQITRTISIPSIKTGMYFIRIDNQSSAIRFIKK